MTYHISSLKSCNQPISPIYNLENVIEQIKITEENLLRFVSIAKDEKPSIRVKIHQIFFVLIFTTICLISAEWM